MRLRVEGYGGVKLGLGCAGQMETTERERERERVKLAELLISGVELEVSVHEQFMCGSSGVLARPGSCIPFVHPYW